MPRQTSVNLIEITEQQVEYLSQYGFENFTNIVRIAIDRLYCAAIELPDEPITSFSFYDMPQWLHLTSTNRHQATKVVNHFLRNSGGLRVNYDTIGGYILHYAERAVSFSNIISRHVSASVNAQALAREFDAYTNVISEWVQGDASEFADWLEDREFDYDAAVALIEAVEPDEVYGADCGGGSYGATSHAIGDLVIMTDTEHNAWLIKPEDDIPNVIIYASETE